MLEGKPASELNSTFACKYPALDNNQSCPWTKIKTEKSFKLTGFQIVYIYQI